MKRKIQNLVTRNQNLIEENLRLKKEIKLVKSPKHRKSVATAEFKKYFSASQTKSIMTGKRVVWSKKDIVNGLMLYCQSKKSYLFIRKKKLFPIPSVTSLKKWVNKLQILPGILYDVLAILEKSISSSPDPLSKLGVLVFDEMDLKRKFEYFKKQDRVFGPSKKVQVAMVRGLCSDWKQPVFFDFDCPMRVNILTSIVTNVEKAGIEVWAITCDGGPTNLSLFKVCQFSMNDTISNCIYTVC